MNSESIWKNCALVDVVVFLKDGSHGTHQDIPEGIPFLSAKDIRDGKLLVPDDCRKISQADYDILHRSYHIRGGDILLTVVGSIGRCCLLTGNEGQFSVQRSVAIIRSADIEPGYLFQFLRTTQFQKTLKELTNASAQGGVYLGALAGASISFPDNKLEQTKIDEILATVDRAIEQTEALIAKQQRIKTGLMHDLLTRGIDEHGKLRSEKTHEFKDSPLGRIPVEWDVLPAKDLCTAVIDCKNRTPPMTSDGNPVIRTPNVRDGKFEYRDLAWTDPESYSIWVARGVPRAGDVVITREAPFGEACQIPTELPAPCLGQRMMMYQTDANKLRADYLVFAIYSETVQARLKELAGGSTVGHIRVGEIRNLEIPHPKCVDEQERISTVLSGAASHIAGLVKDLQKLASLKSALMQDLLTGRKRVTALLADAPSSAM